jgi:hypothetical protein
MRANLTHCELQLLGKLARRGPTPLDSLHEAERDTFRRLQRMGLTQHLWGTETHVAVTVAGTMYSAPNGG